MSAIKDRIISKILNRDGSALLTVLLVVLISSVLVASFFAMSTQRSFMARRLTNRTRAISIAEAGIHVAYSVLVTNFDAVVNDDDAFPVTSYGGGQFDITITPLSNDVVIIKSVGVYAGVSEEVILDVKKYSGNGGGNFIVGLQAFDYAMLCGGTFYFRGCGDISSTAGMPPQTLIHANSDMDIRGEAAANVGVSSSTEVAIGNNITIDGDVTAPNLDYTISKVTITGVASEQSVPFVPIPDIDLTPFYNWARDHGEIYNNFSSSSSYTPNGGILWVNGNVMISSHAVINGSIIATGDVKISGAVDINAPANGFAIASRDGSINITSSGDITGLIYAKVGDYDHTANGQVIGQVIVGGNIKKGGNSDIWLFRKTDLMPPGGIVNLAGQNRLVPRAWQR